MNLENKSVFTTLGWNGKKSFFALNEHFERLESQAKILGLSFDENIKMKIIKQLKIKDLKFDNYNYSNELYKPPGLVTIKLMENNKFLITARSNEYNIKCKFIDAITVNATNEIKENKGMKYGDHLPYKNAFKIAKKNGGNAALLVNDDAIIDGDRGTLIVLDKDGTAWVSSKEYGSIKSITIKLIKTHLRKNGIPLSFGKITTELILRSTDAIMVGTGLGVTRINSIDNRKFEFSNSILFDKVKSIFSELIEEKWTEIKDVDDI